MSAASGKKEPLAAARFSWKKLSAAKWDDAWLERLSFLGPQRVMVISFPNAPKIRVEAHGLTRAEADNLVKHFGGSVSEAKWLTAVAPPERPPLKIRSRLLIVSTERELERLPAKEAGKAVLIPAGMAFGTGDHATTAGCLRFLADVAAELRGQPWEMLDLGTGSGILAIAARKLGATRALAADFDPHAVRVAKENAKANHASALTVKKLDVRAWEPDRTWPVVAANLFSGILIEIAPTLASALAPGGRLIFSGILREQEEEVLKAFRKQKLEIREVVRKGKWIAGTATRGGTPAGASGKLHKAVHARGQRK
jgi:ribosomal protein L11 methyltransferase